MNAAIRIYLRGPRDGRDSELCADCEMEARSVTSGRRRRNRSFKI